MIRRLLLLTFFMGACLMAFAQADSLGIERKGERVLVIHKVQSGQTLFALARRYGATVQAIQEANPVLQQGLKVGQTIKIPYGKTLPKVDNTQPRKTHSVKAGETLYAISRLYNVSVDDLKKWNNLTSNALALGQKIIVEAAPVITDTTPNTSATATNEGSNDTNNTQEVQTQPQVTRDTASNPVGQTETAVADTMAVSTNTASTLDTTTQIQVAPEPVRYNGTPFKEITEEGVAELIEEDEPTKKFLALHKTAKVGTVIKIRNLKNDLAVYVRVIGNIPNTADNENVLIKINKRAHDQLKAIDPRLRVELSYFQ